MLLPSFVIPLTLATFPIPSFHSTPLSTNTRRIDTGGVDNSLDQRLPRTNPHKPSFQRNCGEEGDWNALITRNLLKNPRVERCAGPIDSESIVITTKVGSQLIL